MLAWMQPGGVCLFLHPGALWVGALVQPPPTRCVSGWEQDGVNVYDITVTGQSQHTVAAFPKRLQRKVLKSLISPSSSSFCPIKIKTLSTGVLGNTERITWRWKQEVTQQTSLRFTSVDFLHCCYCWEEVSTHQTQRQTHQYTHHVYMQTQSHHHQVERTSIRRCGDHKLNIWIISMLQ